MTDIIERLRKPVLLHSNPEQTNAERKAAAAEIERLRAALKPFADAVYNDNGDVTVTHPCISAYMKARRALEPKP